MNKKGSFHIDLLSLRPVRALVRFSLFPVVFQVFALAGVVVLAVIGLGHGTNLEPDQLKLFRKTNLTTLAVWGLWWPSMIAIALVFGRAWCTVCPIELVNRIGDIVARKLNLPRARLGKVLRAGWATLVIYLVMQLLVAGVTIHRVPHFTAIMLIALLGLAFVTGLIFHKPRSFCQAFCPALALLSVYGRYTPIQLTKRDEGICENCTRKDCVRQENRYKFDKRSCPSLIKPFDRRPSDHCVLCLQCVKVCPYDNMGVGIVRSDNPIRQKVMLRPFEAAFVMIAMGFVAHEVISEIKWLDAYFHAIPKTLSILLPDISFAWFEALWFLVLFPMLVWMLISIVGLLLGHRSGIKSLLLSAATGAAPIIALAHLAKAVAKVSSWGGFLPGAISDVAGITTFERISAGAVQAPAGLMAFSFVGWMMLLATSIIAWRAWKWVRHIPADSSMAARSGLVTTTLFFIGVLLIWALPIH